MTGRPHHHAEPDSSYKDGPLEIAPQTEGQQHLRGNLDIISGTGGVVARQRTARLCRCRQSNNESLCEGSMKGSASAQREGR